MSLVQQKIEADTDDHVFIIIEQEEKPILSIDLNNDHHRRGMSVRIDGMTVFSAYVDVESPQRPTGKRMQRFCPYCGEERNLVSSVDRHTCKNEYDEDKS